MKKVARRPLLRRQRSRRCRRRCSGLRVGAPSPSGPREARRSIRRSPPRHGSLGIAAGAVGWLAERGSDRKILTAFASFVVGQLIIFAFGLAGLKLAAPELVELGFMSSSSWSTVVHDGFTIFIIGGLVKAAIGSILMPAAWKLAERTR